MLSIILHKAICIFHIVLMASLISMHSIAQVAPVSPGLFEPMQSLGTSVRDSSIRVIQQRLDKSIQDKDTATMVQCRFSLANRYSGNGEFSKSYEEVWEILPLVEKPEYIEDKLKVINKLIGLYLIYEQHDKAIARYHELPQLIAHSNLEPQKIRLYEGRYYSLGAWIELKTTRNLEKAEALSLKASAKNSQLHDKRVSLHHTQVQLANIYMQMGKAQEAFQILSTEDKLYPLPLQPVHALLYFRMAEYYELTDNLVLAEHYLLLSQSTIDRFHTLSDKKPIILGKLARIKAKEQKYREAYTYQLQAAKLNEQLFSAQTAQNSQLFEIKDRYQEQLKNQDLEIQNQKFALLSKTNSLFRLRAYSLLVSFAIFAIMLIVILRRRAKQNLLKQTLINQEQTLELRKQKEILEVKNKELLSSAMQLLERENEQAEIKRQLDKLSLTKQNKKIIQQIRIDLKIDKSQKWKEFESRFVAVNSVFFSSLKEAYPKLTPTDLKICAFIKLGFTSKDMAQIMGITVEGINTTRSRLRKKMSLNREVVLVDYLQAFP